MAGNISPHKKLINKLLNIFWEVRQSAGAGERQCHPCAGDAITIPPRSGEQGQHPGSAAWNMSAEKIKALIWGLPERAQQMPEHCMQREKCDLNSRAVPALGSNR